jgi:predicted DNA-binding protein
MASQVVSLRLPQGMVKRLRALARRLSVVRGQDLTWAEIVRETLQQRLAAPGPRRTEAA